MSFSVDAFAAKLAESFGDWGDDDLDFYGIYGSYTGFEDVVIDAYWLFIRDDVAFAGADADLHTVGARVAGALGAIDLELEGALSVSAILRFPMSSGTTMTSSMEPSRLTLKRVIPLT